MKRREFLQRALLTPGVAAIAGRAPVATQSEAPRIAFTFDDFNVFDVPALSALRLTRQVPIPPAASVVAIPGPIIPVPTTTARNSVMFFSG